MTRELTIKELLFERGIETRPSAHLGCKELWRGEEFLGDFSAQAAVDKFLLPEVEAAISAEYSNEARAQAALNAILPEKSA